MTDGFPAACAGAAAVATFSGFEADLLRSLASQLIELLRNEAAVPTPTPTRFEALLDFSGPTTAPDDPVLARLFPTAYREDEEAAARLPPLHRDRAAQRQGRCRRPRHRRARGGRAARPDRERPDHRRRARPRRRPALAEVDDRHAAGAGQPARHRGRATRTTGGSLPDDDPRVHVHDIYDWLGFLQETLVRAVSP